MSLNLEVKATHKPKSDLLELQVYVYDQDDQKFHPERIRSGKATLFHAAVGGRQVLGAAAFDRREGTADGCVRVFFLHPRYLQEVSFDVAVEIDGSVTLTKSGVFTILPPPVTETNLVEQPAVNFSSPRLTGKKE